MINPETRFIILGDGHEISYLEYEGEGPTVVLLHATGFVPWLWHPIARTLSSRFRVIVPTLYNRPGEPPEAGGISWKLLAKDVTILCTMLGIEIPYFVGHSMGGVVATIACGEYGINSAAMVLIEPIFLSRHLYNHPMTVDTHPLASKARRRTSHWHNRTAARRYLTSRPLFAGWDREVLDLYVTHGMIEKDGGLSLACSPEQEAALFMGGMGYNPWPILPSVSCPVLVVEGSISDNRNFIDLSDVVSALPQGSYRLVADGGHLLPMEQPEKVAKIIDNFFGTVQPDLFP
jgi:pimeloyl-ACP methyl ester carboxylesterase